VLAAARIYGAIADKVDALGSAAWDRRVGTDRSEKLREVAAAWLEARAQAPAPSDRTGLWTRRSALDA
jgi:phytoene synthase